jgi:hypothetical protein
VPGDTLHVSGPPASTTTGAAEYGTPTDPSGRTVSRLACVLAVKVNVRMPKLPAASWTLSVTL